MQDEKEIIIYTLVLHQARKKLGLTLAEYCVTDSIYHLSNNPKSEIKGWCYASKETLGRYLNLTERTIWSILNKIIKKGIVEKHKEKKGFLRTTQLWYDSIVMTRIEMRADPEVSSGSRKKYQVDPEKTSGKTLTKLQTIKITNKDKDNILSAKADPNFNFKEKLNQLLISDKKYIRIIAKFWEIKGYKFDNKVQYQFAFRRELRPAKKLVGYSEERISEVMKWLEKNTDFAWKLETIHKFIDEKLDKLQVKKEVKKPYYNNMLVIEKNNKKYCIPNDGGKWLEFAGLENDIIYK